MRVFSLTLMLFCVLATGSSLGWLSSINTARAATSAVEASTSSSIGEPSYKASPRRAAMLRRVITVSVLNDRSAPVRPERITALLAEAFAEYERELNIEFQLVESLPYKGDLTL